MKSEDILARVSAQMGLAEDSLVTFASIEDLISRSTIVSSADSVAMERLGITVTGAHPCTICILNPEQRVGKISVIANGKDALLVIGEVNPSALPTLQIRIKGDGCLLAFCDLRTVPVWLADIYLRGNRQVLFWGAGASAVHAQIELAGDDSRLMVGDDCMLSSGIWIRNHDMHAIFDTTTHEVINAPCREMRIEQHVWIGQGSLVLGVDRIGFGSIVGAYSLVNNPLAPESLVVGKPARVIRTGVSWSRAESYILPADRERLARLQSILQSQTSLPEKVNSPASGSAAPSNPN